MNYDLYRPVDLDLVKAGHKTISRDGKPARLVGCHSNLESDSCVVWDVEGRSSVVLTGVSGHHYRSGISDYDILLAPLCWVKDKPVYKGDRLYATYMEDTEGFVVDKYEVFEGVHNYRGEGAHRLWGMDGMHRPMYECQWEPHVLSKVRLMAHVGGKWIEGDWQQASDRAKLTALARDRNAYYGQGTHWVEEQGSEVPKPLTKYLNVYPDTFGHTYSSLAEADANCSKQRVGQAMEFTFPRT